MFTTTQTAALLAAIAADPVLQAFPLNSDGSMDMANYLAQPSSPAFYVWKGSMPVDEIFDQITWANFTPADDPDGTLLWQNRSHACQGKQFTLQTMLAGRDTLNVSRANVRGGLQDALTGLPSGAGGVKRSAGWVPLLATLYRLANKLEAILATGTDTTASPATMTFEGKAYGPDISTVRGFA